MKPYIEQLEKNDQEAIHVLQRKISELSARSKNIDVFLTKFLIEELKLETNLIKLKGVYGEICAAIDNDENDKTHTKIGEFLGIVKELKEIDRKLEKDEEIETGKLKSEEKLLDEIAELDSQYVKDEAYFSEPKEVKELVKKIMVFVLGTDETLDEIINAWTKMKELINKAEATEDYSTVKDKYTDDDKDKLGELMDEIISTNEKLAKDMDKKRENLKSFFERCSLIGEKLEQLHKEVNIDLNKMLQEL